MLRKIGAIFIALFVSVSGLVSVGFDNGDTGAYEILNYTCQLQPQPDSTVLLTITQDWLVTDGHIPWVSVGLPDPNFNVEKFSGAATGVRADNSGGWSGVMVTLDKDYQAGATFQFTFTVRQRDLMQDGEINYTPGWYDSAVTDTLAIQAIIPPGAGDVSYSPAPQSADSSSITWEKRALKKGERFNIDVTFSGLVSAGTPVLSAPGEWLNNIQVVLALIIPFVIAVFTAVYFIKRRRTKSSLSVPPLEPPKKHEEITLDKDGKVVNNVETDDEDTDKEDNEYTRPVVRPVSVYPSCVARSCACVSCACVSCACACACACAGGHGAGCAKKGLLDCQKCERKETCSSNIFINNGVNPAK